MKKISLMGANLDTGNMGVGALMMGAITCTKNIWPDAEISLLEYDEHPKTFECRLGGALVPVRLVPLRFSKKIYLPNNIARLLLQSVVLRFLPFPALRNRAFKKNSCLQHLHDADLVLSIAGGDSFSDIYGMERFFYITLPLLWAIVMGKKIVLMPQTIGPFKNVFTARIAAFIMKRSSMVYARDNESLLVARRLMGRRRAAKARFCYDIGFVLDPVKPTAPAFAFQEKNTRSKLLVGLNISGLLCMGGYSGKNMFALKIDYSDLMRSLIKYLIEVKKTIVVLVPHVFGTFPESDTEAVSRFFNELTGEYGTDLLCVEGDYDQNEIKYIIGQCNFFIGSRMHACIAALSQCVPAVGIAYSRKFAGVMQSIGVEHLIADPRKNSKMEILELIGRAIDAREKWTRLLREKMPHIQCTVRTLLDEKPGMTLLKC